jgi:hypothetical protein
VHAQAVVKALVHQSDKMRDGLWRLCRVGFDFECAFVSLENEHGTRPRCRRLTRSACALCNSGRAGERKNSD